MSTKVFLFGQNNWLVCSGVSFDGEKWRGSVVNGGWHMTYVPAAQEIRHERGSSAITLTWACDPIRGHYDDVIADAKTRYQNGEPANYDLSTPAPALDEDDEIAF